MRESSGFNEIATETFSVQRNFSTLLNLDLVAWHDPSQQLSTMQTHPGRDGEENQKK